MDLAMGTLLLAAFFSINLLSLVYLTMIAVGMAVPPHPRRLIWRYCVLPLLALLLITQYSFFIGLPPPFDRDAPLGGFMGSSADGKASWLMRRHHDSDTDSVKASRTHSSLNRNFYMLCWTSELRGFVSYRSDTEKPLFVCRTGWAMGILILLHFGLCSLRSPPLFSR